MNARAQWLDALKGLGIALVVLGHIPRVSDSWLGTLIYSFHVPLFFSLSGATLLGASSRSMTLRVLSLLWVYGAVSFLTLPWAVVKAPDPPLWNAFLGSLYGSALTVRVGPMWFLPCLALSIPLAYLMMLWVARNGDALRSRIYLLIAALSLISIGGLFLSMEPLRTDFEHRIAWGAFSRSGAFWSCDVAILGAGFLLLGAVIKVEVDNASRAKLLWLCASAGAVFLVAFDGFSRVELAFGSWRQPIQTSVAAIAGTVLAYSAVRLYANRLSWLAALGRATLPILVFHVAIYRFFPGLLGSASSSWVVVPAMFLSGLLIPWLLDWYFFSKSEVGRWIFYPRPMIDSCLDRLPYFVEEK